MTKPPAGRVSSAACCSLSAKNEELARNSVPMRFSPCVENLTDQVRAGSCGDRTAGSFGPHHDVAAGADVDDLRIGLIARVGEVRLLGGAPYFRRRGHDGICLNSSPGDDGESLRHSLLHRPSLRATERFTP
jgi:hypothetical protein